MRAAMRRAERLLVGHHGLVTRVPLEQRSTTRLVIGFGGTIVLPVAVLVLLVCYCVVQFGNAFGDFLRHLPFL